MASGLGLKNIVYQGDLNDIGDTPSSPSPQGMYSHLLAQGATKGEALMLTGAAASESDFDTGAVHDHGVGYGMFGHNGSRLLAMKNYASKTGGSLSDWRTQANFALQELRSRPEGLAAAKATTPEQVALAQMHYEAPQGFTANDPTAGHNYTGRLNTIRKFTALDPNATGAFAPSANPQVSPAATGGADMSAGLAPIAGGAPGGGMAAGGVADNPFGSVGNPQLNAALAHIMAQSRSTMPEAQKPLVTQLLGAAVNPIRQGLTSGLSSLLGGLSAPGAADGMSPSSAPAAGPAPTPSPIAAPPVDAATTHPVDPPMPVPRPPEFGGAVQMAGMAPVGGGQAAPLFTLGGMFGG